MQVSVFYVVRHSWLEKGEGKCIYIALIFVVHARRSGMDHSVLPANTSTHNRLETVMPTRTFSLEKIWKLALIRSLLVTLSGQEIISRGYLQGYSTHFLFIDDDSRDEND